MKRGIKNIWLALVACAAVSFVSCEDVIEEGTPAFPKKVEATVMAGDDYSFTFTANMSWTLTIPNESYAFFKFIDGEVERRDLNGRAGTHTVTVGVSDIEEFEVNRVCEITMTMGNESEVVAVLTRGGKERNFALYVAENYTDEETGDILFSTDADGNYIYSSTPAERIDWVWSNEQWMQRVVVEANFEWFLSPAAPKWLNINAANGAAGRTELFLRVNREQLPLEDVECDIEFGAIYITNSTDSNFETIGSYPTTMEGCMDVCEVNLPATLNFNSNGDYYQASSDSYVELVNGRFSSPRGAELVLLSKNADGSYSSDATSTKWMRMKMDEFPEEAGDYGVWERAFTFEVGINSSTEEREGAIAAIPQPVAALGNYNPEEYIVCTFIQDGYVEVVEVETIYPNDNEIMAIFNSKFEKLTQGTWPWMGTWKNVPNGYKLTYNNNNSGDDLIFTQPFTRYEIYGFDGDGRAPYDLETCWLTIEPSEEHKGLENGYIIRSRLGETIDDVTYDNPMGGSLGENEATIIFYNENEEAYALIYFILDPNYYTPTDGPTGTIDFANDDYAALGATLEVIAEGDNDYTKEWAGALQYRLTLNPNCTQVILIVPEFLYAFEYTAEDWLVPSGSSSRLTVTVDTELLPALEEGATQHKNHITLNSASYDLVANLVVVYNMQ